MSDLERRIARLEMAQAINDLKIEYALLCDDGYDGDKLKQLFTEDAVWDGGETFGRHEGREAIGVHFSGFQGNFTWALHYMIGPQVTAVSDDALTAEATWYLWMPFNQADGDGSKPMLFTAKQYDRYRMVDGRLFFSEIRVDAQSMGTMEEGWTER